MHICMSILNSFPSPLFFVFLSSLLFFSVVFDCADALLVSEVKMLLEHRQAQYESQEEDYELSEVSRRKRRGRRRRIRESRRKKGGKDEEEKEEVVRRKRR